jgi:hypothetical protein
MPFPYLQNKNWSDITRDERFFCAELYNEIKQNPIVFIELLQTKIPTLKVVNNIEVGFEVCFFRDYVKEFGDENGNKSIKNSTYSQKRTFDLCLFLENSLLIIEAKSYTGFDTKQLEDFNKDQQYIKQLLGDKCPTIYSIGLTSSNYKPRSSSIIGFNALITWGEMFKLYNNLIFKRANTHSWD